jgi:hypothetical protein
MPLRTSLIFTSPFLVVALAVSLLKPSAGATILFFITAVFAACMLSLVGDLSKGGSGPAFGERKQMLALALSQKKPFAACVDCLSLIDEGGAECGYCGSKRGLTFIIDRRHKDRVKAMVPRHLH